MSSLQQKITLWISGVLLAVFLAAGYFIWWESQRELATMAHEQAQAIVSVLDNSIGTTKRLQDIAWLQSMIDRMSRGGLIKEISIHDAGKNYSITASSVPEKVGAQADPEDISVAQEDKAVVLDVTEKGQHLIDMTVPLHEGNQVIGLAGIKVNMETLDRKTANIVKWTFVIMVLGWALAFLLLSWLIRKLVVQPVAILSNMAKQVSSEDLTVEDIVTKGNDEIACLGAAFNVMKNNLKRTVHQLKDISQGLYVSAQQLTNQAQQTSAGAAENAATMDEIAGTVEDMSKNTRDISLQSTIASEHADKGYHSIEMVNDQMQEISSATKQVNTSINALSLAINRIGQFVEVITNIAEQTNLLSLNAAIEAAKAGDAGRGFAVVAEEVKKLAEQSAHSTKEIRQLIEEIHALSEQAEQAAVAGIDKVDQGNRVVGKVGQNFSEIIKAVQELFDQLHKIVSSTHLVSSGVQSVVGTTEEQTTAMEEVSAATEGLYNLADKLNTLVMGFKI